MTTFYVSAQSKLFGDYENCGSYATRAEAEAQAEKIRNQKLPLPQFGNVEVLERRSCWSSNPILIDSNAEIRAEKHGT